MSRLKHILCVLLTVAAICTAGCSSEQPAGQSGGEQSSAVSAKTEMSKEEYHNKLGLVIDNMKIISESNEKADYDSMNGEDQLYYIDMYVTAFTLVSNTIREMENIAPPEECKDVHEKLTEAGARLLPINDRALNAMTIQRNWFSSFFLNSEEHFRGFERLTGKLSDKAIELSSSGTETEEDAALRKAYFTAYMAESDKIKSVISIMRVGISFTPEGADETMPSIDEAVTAIGVLSGLEPPSGMAELHSDYIAVMNDMKYDFESLKAYLAIIRSGDDYSSFADEYNRTAQNSMWEKYIMDAYDLSA